MTSGALRVLCALPGRKWHEPNRDRRIGFDATARSWCSTLPIGGERQPNRQGRSEHHRVDGHRATEEAERINATATSASLRGRHGVAEMQTPSFAGSSATCLTAGGAAVASWICPIS